VFAAADVHYPPSGGARAALVLASDVTFSTIVSEKTVFVEHVAPYEPGEFYRRELPPLRALLADVGDLDLLIIDGYVTLDPAGKPGLGAYAHAEFAVPVIGVAKTRFASAAHAIPVLRGNAKRPLYVTSAGIEPADAAELVRTMTGGYRLPDALRRADSLARGHRTRNSLPFSYLLDELVSENYRDLQIAESSDFTATSQ
jgi:deoxyribonuclease V